MKRLSYLSVLFILAIFGSNLALADTCQDVFVSEAFSRAVERLNARLEDPSYKVIVLARHGKASQENKFTSAERSIDPAKVALDIERPLAKKGRRAAKKISQLIGKLHFGNVGMWGSYANRVKETAAHTKRHS